jgi:hypothetical protein
MHSLAARHQRHTFKRSPGRTATSTRRYGPRIPDAGTVSTGGQTTNAYGGLRYTIRSRALMFRSNRKSRSRGTAAADSDSTAPGLYWMALKEAATRALAPRASSGQQARPGAAPWANPRRAQERTKATAIRKAARWRPAAEAGRRASARAPEMPQPASEAAA